LEGRLMFDAIGTALSWCYDLTGNYGLAIMLLTLGIMVLLTPLTLKGTRSMIAMQRLQPEMKKLQSKYKDDRQKLNEEMLKFYKEHNINPVGGCLPLLLQTPVFIVLYRVLHGLTNPHAYAEDMGRAFGLAGADPKAVYEHFGTFDPSYLDPTSQLYKDLSVAREMKAFGLDLATSASSKMSEGIIHALPYLALIAIIGVTAWYQQRQIQGRNPQMASQVNPQQQMLMKIFPYFLPVISFTLPAGIVLYFLVSNLYRIGQQAFITRTMYRDEHGNPIHHGGSDAASGDKSGDKASAERPKGILASLRQTMAESGPRVGPNANGGKTPAKGAKSAPAKTKPSTKGAAKATNTTKGGGKNASGTSKGGGKTPVKAAKNAGTNRTAQKSGGSSSSSRTTEPEAAAPDEKAAAPSTRAASSPSRRPPAPNPNRSRAKKRRR
jgi:YidC/Oxa1 family membrane protein insertase